MELNNEERTDLRALAEELSEKYGRQELSNRIIRFLTGLHEIATINTRLAQLEEAGDADAYDKAVQQILSLTDTHYRTLGEMPEDIRRFFLMLNSSPPSKVDDITASFGLDVETNAASILSVQAIRPKNYVMQLDAVSNHLAVLSGQTQLTVGRRDSQPVTATVTLDMPDHMKIEGGHALSTYDKSIINAVTSLIESGNFVFTIPMLYHAMTGRQNPTIDDSLAEEITSKLEKMRRMILSIDLTEESEAYPFLTDNGETLDVSDLSIEGYLLPLNKVSGVVNGKKAELYQIIQHPPLYTYSKMKRQLASVNISLLGAPVNNNATTIPLKTYLLQRIELMKNKKNNIISKTILYESVYKELGAQNADKTRKMRIRNYACTILAYFTDQKYIKGYSEFKQGRSVAGVHIDL